MYSRLALWTIFGFGALVGAVACSGSGTPAIAQQIINAIDTLFDNTASGLAGTNVQAALDEVDGNVDQNRGDIGTNSNAIDTLNNDLVDLQNTVAGLGGGGGINPRTITSGSAVTGIVTVQGNGGVADIQPPAGEVWVIDVFAGAGNGNINVGYTDGVIEVVPGLFGKFGGPGQSFVISNAMCLRFKNNNAADTNVFYSAHRIQAELVFLLENVADGNTVNFRPPAGEIWLVARAHTTVFNQEFLDLTNGILTAPGIWLGPAQDYTLFPIDNTNYLTYTNNSGGTIGVAIAALRLP